MTRKQITRFELTGFLLSPSLFVMIILMVVEAMLAATTTWLVINAGRKVAENEFLTVDLIWILSAQSVAYVEKFNPADPPSPAQVSSASGAPRP